MTFLMNTSRRAVYVALLLALVVGAASAQKRGFAPEDIYLLQQIADPQVSPDGKTVVYTVTQIDKARNRRQSSVWTVPVDGSAAPRKLTSGNSARNPRWSPDGSVVAFVSNAVEQPTTSPQSPETPPNRPDARPAPANTKTQVYSVSPNGGEPTRVTNIKDGVSRFSWSPDGTRLACVVKASPEHTPDSDTKHYRSMVYKMDGQGYADVRRSHLFVVDVKSGKTTQITNDANHDDNDPQWSPDGKWISYSSANSSPELRNVIGVGDVFIVSASGGAPRPLAQGRMYASDPRWSPDGKWIAFAAAPSVEEQAQLWVIPAQGGTAKLGTEMDLFPTSINWSEDGQLYFTALERGAQVLFRAEPQTGKTTRVLAGNRSINNVELADKLHRIVFVANDSQHPAELFAADFDGKNEKQLSHHNQAGEEQIATQPATEFSYPSVDGLTIEAFLIKPINFQPGKKYPMVLNIHGGPNGMWGYNWCSDCQMYAGQGWAVLLINPRGSSGYGMKFQRAVALEWGGKAYQDIMNGVQTALTQNPWIDKDRLGVTGVSYGGFMTDWMVTQTDIFKAAVPISGISDLVSVEGTRDGAFGHSRDFGGDLWQAFDNYWKYSAVRLASKVTTPVLLLHGEADHRVPYSQAEEYFRALKHFGKTAEIVLFPREPHSPGAYEPKHQVEHLQWRVYWFDRYLNGNTQALAPDQRRPAAEQPTVASQ
jgi:dipeptidyl aminopeptidase/acylaminoacyl peptidase